jgi:hypothetical protein
MTKSDSNGVVRRLSELFRGRLNIMRACGSPNYSGIKVNILCDQVLDSVIVAGITGVSAYVYAGQDAYFKAAVLSFVLTFLIKMKEYRKIS